jgi:TonB family protein
MRRFLVFFLALSAPFFFATLLAQNGESQSNRRIVSRAAPLYPALARTMHIGGVVKVEARVAPNGVVKNVSIRGGPPILTVSAAEAVRKWKWAPATRESWEAVEVKFTPFQ